MMKRLVGGLVGVVLVLCGVLVALYWFTFRVYVPEGQCVVMVKKTGTAPRGKLAENPGEKGIQKDVLGPGRYFFNPVIWEAKYIPQVEISSGDPRTWEWVQTPPGKPGAVTISKGKFPEVGVLKRVIGPKPPNGVAVVSRASGLQGTIREVLTPGSYRINPWVYTVEKHAAVVIPAGYVGVVTNQVGAAAPLAAGAEGGDDMVRRLARMGERGTLRDVLQPGIYYINPYVQRVTLIEIGFNEYSQVKVSETENNRISFPSDTGYDIRVGVTIIWGIDPKHAAQIINEFGNVDRVLETVIGSQLPSICRNIGSTYDARDFIHGEKRELFQRALTEKLQEVCSAKNVDVLLALVREIEVHAPKAAVTAGAEEEVTEDLKRTIQQSYIAIENRITKEKQREAAVVRAELEEARKKVDIARETIQAETRVMVAQILADAEKQSAEVDAQAKLEVAQIQEQIAQLDAQRTEILGTAKADVERYRKQAEADGYKLLVDAFGGGRAFNLYTFAENFQPQSIRIFFAGDGTFWTDLDRFQDVGAAKILQPASAARD
ncbi:MAG TPA: SPFH domain-containing protein [Phycisphaerae bacterium]|nr:SPFH domain-containing protein [Phycisphaerae bacterium]